MPQGLVNTYDLTVGVIVDMENMIHMLDPSDTPLLGQYSADGRSVLPKGTTFEKKVEWMDETLLTPRDTLGEALDTTETAIDIDTANKFGVGDIILIDAEYMRVTGVNAAGTTLTVTRAYSGSAASHDDNAVVVGVGLALAEGSDPEAARTVDRTARYNMTQIFGPYAVHVSGTEDVVRKYGLPGGSGEFSYQAGKLAREVAVAREQALLYGTRLDASDIRTMGGMAYYISTNVDSSTTTFAEDKLLIQLQACYDAGGNPDRIVLGSKNKRLASAFATPVSSSTIHLDRADRGRGTIVDHYISDFGTAAFVLNRWCRTADVFVFERAQAEEVTLRPLQFEMLAKTGDSKKGQLLAETSLKFRREKHAAKFTALT